MIITVSRATCTMNEPDRQDIQGPGLDEHRAEKSPGWFRSVEKGVGRSFHVAERMISRIAQRRTLSVFLVGLLSFLWSATFSLLIRMPRPMVHDEFSYLLAADTFAHGRLTNPTHPLWVHFESMHIIHRPTYASKYPPGQGLALAAGQVLTGYPIVGAWLSTALACSAICWMLMAWMPPRWALIGGILAAIHPTTLEWSQTYWGGSVAMLGGALLLGAAGRLAKHSRVRDSLLMGVGLLVLANSRPYEGLVLSILVLLALLLRLISRWGPGWCISLTRIVLPSSIVLVVGAASMCYYNYRVTRSALRLPYSLHEESYAITPPFLWMEARPIPEYRHAQIKNFHERILKEYYCILNSSHMILLQILRVILAQIFLLNVFTVMMLIGLLNSPWLVSSHEHRFSALGWVFFTLSILPETWIHPHYFAPAFGLALLLTMQALRLLWLWRGVPVGRLIKRSSLVLCIAWLLASGLCLSDLNNRTEWRSQISRRDSILERLEGEGGNHLVIVRYGANHDTNAEWVYNAADIDSAKVVWAQEMGPDQDRELLNYFKGRRIWLLEPDLSPVRLTDYSKSTSQ